MLNIYRATAQASHVWKQGDPLPDDAVWLDLLNPDAVEIKTVEEFMGEHLPSRERISGIGLASRNHGHDEAVYLHVSRFAGASDEHVASSPLGVVLTAKVLVTQRYVQSPAFEQAAHVLQSSGCGASAEAFVTVVEAITDHTAELMQEVAGDLADLDGKVFVSTRLRTRALRDMMLHVGKLETRLARSRTSLLGTTRVVSFLCDRSPPWFPDATRIQLQSLDNDLKALDEFDDHLTGKVQFLLDAILGFINTDQNEVMKLLTVASVVTIPPVILAGIWGMNFRHMPELKWQLGYPLALTALFVSIAVPLLWFKWKGWLSKD